MILLIVSLLFIALGLGLLVVGFFRPPPEADYEAAFKVNVDYLDRHTIFDLPGLRVLVWPFYQFARRIAGQSFRRRILRNLRSSGNPKGYSPEEYITLCLLWGVGAALATVVFFEVFTAGRGVHPALLVVVFVFAFVVCELSLDGKAAKRLRQINQQLPYGLDLIAMTMQAGATFYEAAKTVAEENPDEPLDQELGIVVREIEFGRSRQEALQHFADRIPIESLSSIIAAILQAEQLGTPLAEVLVLQANLLRMYRSMRAEKTLGEATVKILIPSVLIFMAAILVIFGPIIVRVMTKTFFVR
jgi:tight adherence protein C